jgi:hypothetical protein
MTISIFRDSEISNSIEKLVNKMDQKTRAIWAAKCGEHVSKILKKDNPKEFRPSKAIIAAKKWGMNKLSADEVRDAELNSKAAALDADTLPELMFAKAAEHAAAVANSKGHSVVSATYAAKAVFHRTEDSLKDSALKKEREWQFDLLTKMISEES